MKYTPLGTSNVQNWKQEEIGHTMTTDQEIHKELFVGEGEREESVSIGQ